jgi:hypothetical protein
MPPFNFPGVIVSAGGFFAPESKDPYCHHDLSLIRDQNICSRFLNEAEGVTRLQRSFDFVRPLRYLTSLRMTPSGRFGVESA